MINGLRIPFNPCIPSTRIRPRFAAPRRLTVFPPSLVRCLASPVSVSAHCFASSTPEASPFCPTRSLCRRLASARSFPRSPGHRSTGTKAIVSNFVRTAANLFGGLLDRPFETLPLSGPYPWAIKSFPAFTASKLPHSSFQFSSRSIRRSIETRASAK